MERILYNYFRSSASHRVRIAMNLKRLRFSYKAIHLNRGGGEQFSEQYSRLNPQKLVPVLDDGEPFQQSMAILEYLEEVYPAVPLLPDAPFDRAYVRAVALHCACDVHPLTNLRVLKFLTGPMNVSEDKKLQWISHWIALGLDGLEESIKNSARRGRFCFKDQQTMADCCLVPLLFSARRFQVDVSRYSVLSAIEDACNGLEAFRAAHPSQQPDSE